MRETWNGPKAMLGVVASAADEARDHWTNANAFCAHFVKLYGDVIPLMSCYRIYALWTISSALEYGIQSRRGEDLWLDIPAAAKWVEILGSEMRDWVDDYEGWPGADGGTLWKAESMGMGFRRSAGRFGGSGFVASRRIRCWMRIRSTLLRRRLSGWSRPKPCDFNLCL
ncbi:hypothetical protein BFW01_g4808 [Lasiodiplodia theobromae]|nr:hypothetical protein BFW01_g4808 [Lasiodiplodia theobromae]